MPEEEELMTDEELKIAAMNNLNAAIQNYVDIYFGTGQSVGDYVVALAAQRLSTDGEYIITDYPVIMRDGDIPWYRCMGLLDMATGIVKMNAFDPVNNG